MSPPVHSIFRPEALEYRLRHRGVPPAGLRLPALMARRSLFALWLAVLIAVMAGGGVFLGTVPRSASGLAVVPDAAVHQGQVAVLLTTDQVGAVEPGQAAQVSFGGVEIPGRVVAVDRAVAGTEELATRLGLPLTTLAMLPAELGVAWIEIEGDPQRAAGVAAIELGSRRAGSYLPLVGQWFGEQG